MRSEDEQNTEDYIEMQAETIYQLKSRLRWVIKELEYTRDGIQSFMVRDQISLVIEGCKRTLSET